jgi:hypothetical protein
MDKKKRTAASNEEELMVSVSAQIESVDPTQVIFYAILAAQKNKSKLTPEAIKHNMSTEKVRHLFNNIGSCISTYLEVGTYTGGSAIAVAHDNPNVRVFTVDDFSYVDLDDEANALGLRETAKKNLAPYENVQLIESDALKVEVKQFPKIECFFYDGDHEERSQHNALLHYHSCWADEVILIVDDWNWWSAQHGTLTALDKIPFQRVWSIHLEGKIEPEIDKEGYWNGIWIALLKRK